MLLTISTAGPAGDLPDPRPTARDLGRVLHKHPDRVQSFSTASGQVHVFYPEADDQRTTVAVLLEVDPIGLRRSTRPGDPAQYVDARPYLAGSLFAVALRTVFGTAMAGRCAGAPELAARAWDLQVRLPTLPCRGSEDLPQRLFGPLGWQVDATPVPADDRFPEWGEAPFVDATLRQRIRVADALGQLYVLLPVLDDAKHYFVGAEDVEKLLRKAGDWLGGHPESALVTHRYLAHRRPLAAEALRRLADSDEVPVEQLDDALTPSRLAGAAETAELAALEETPDGDAAPAVGTRAGEPVPRGILAVQRHDAIVAALTELRPGVVGDLGCGSGALVRRLLEIPSVERVLGCDVSAHAIAIASRRLRLDRPVTRASLADRVQLFQSSLVYTDDRLTGLDAAVLMEVVEHVDPSRLPALERAVFGRARPRSVLVTTPNVEYNSRYQGLPAGQLRHRDHRFEWTRHEFAEWAQAVASTYGYRVRLSGIGEPDDEVGQPSQLAVFEAETPAQQPVLQPKPKTREVSR